MAKEALKELGKQLNNLALLFAGTCIIQPLIEGKLSLTLALLGVGGYIFFTFVGFILILIGEKLEEGSDGT
ncbi:MAG: hypothetical protein DSZ31_06660 [Gammaproteobacteria bacterium]|nr:MAG: hypothetical protein DSZ31_06660 [Gammaproteobacteria bacterium]RTZ68606.1 MAG: hypothetical protein DSZ30_03975 [Aquificaceae bacterium]